MKVLADTTGYFVDVDGSSKPHAEYGPLQGLATIPGLGLVLARDEHANMAAEDPNNGDGYYVFTDKTFEILQYTGRGRELQMPFQNSMLAQFGRRVIDGTDWGKLSERHSDGKVYFESDSLSTSVGLTLIGNLGQAKLVVLKIQWGQDRLYQVTDSKGHVYIEMFSGTLAIQGDTIVIYRKGSLAVHNRLEILDTNTKEILMSCPGDSILPIANGFYLVHDPESDKCSIWYKDKITGSSAAKGTACSRCGASTKDGCVCVTGRDAEDNYMYCIQVGPKGLGYLD